MGKNSVPRIIETIFRRAYRRTRTQKFINKYMKIKITPNTLNAWRIIPRIIITLYGYIFYEIIHWFMSLDSPNNAQAMFISTIVGASPAFFGLYVNSGKENNKYDTS